MHNNGICNQFFVSFDFGYFFLTLSHLSDQDTKMNSTSNEHLDKEKIEIERAVKLIDFFTLRFGYSLLFIDCEKWIVFAIQWMWYERKKKKMRGQFSLTSDKNNKVHLISIFYSGRWQKGDENAMKKLMANVTTNRISRIVIWFLFLSWNTIIKSIQKIIIIIQTSEIRWII